MTNANDRKTAPNTDPLPPDDLNRNLTIARPNTDQSLPHIAMVGDTYTVLMSGKDTAGMYCLFDMHVPPCGGPSPHRHDFEEMFSILEGEVEFHFRGEKLQLKAGETINIPANAPHFFRNESTSTVRLLCMCSPAGQEEFFMRVGVPVDGRTTQPPEPNDVQKKEFQSKAKALALQYRNELL